MVDDVGNCISAQGIVQRHRDRTHLVASLLGDDPVGAVLHGDAKVPILLDQIVDLKSTRHLQHQGMNLCVGFEDEGTSATRMVGDSLPETGVVAEQPAGPLEDLEEGRAALEAEVSPETIVGTEPDVAGAGGGAVQSDPAAGGH